MPRLPQAARVPCRSTLRLLLVALFALFVCRSILAPDGIAHAAPADVGAEAGWSGASLVTGATSPTATPSVLTTSFSLPSDTTTLTTADGRIRLVIPSDAIPSSNGTATVTLTSAPPSDSMGRIFGLNPT